MTILALDLTSAFGSVAIRKDGETRCELALDSADGFAHLIFPAIEKALRIAQLELAAIDCFAAANGPGAFTGVRVGLTAIKGLAEVLGKPAAGISNLRALSTFGVTGFRAAVLDARRGDVFAGLYDGALESLEPETVSKLPVWLDALPKRNIEFIVQDPALLENIPVIVAPRRLAGAVAWCAEMDGKRGLWIDPAALDANYVRRPDAELLWRDHSGKGNRTA